MLTIHTSSRCAAIALVAGAAAAAAVARPADLCNPAIPYTMPDHDQGRSAGPGVVGLQNNGSQYCVPTCTMNILTYLQNHGYPNLSAGPGPGPWLGTQQIYNSFSSDIEALAGLMNTDPLGGTGGNDAFAGVNQWIDNAGYNGDIIVSMFGMGGNSAPELGDIAFSLVARCPISLSVGWYQSLGNNNFVRAGGHCVTAVRLPDYCSPFKKLSIHDPASSIGSNALSQAPGTTETYNVQNQLITRRDPDDNSVIYSGPALRVLGYGSANKSAFVDGYRAYFPAFGLSACNNPVNGSCVQQFMPDPSFTTLPSSIPLSFPAGASVLDLDIAADNLSSWAIVRIGAGDIGVWRTSFGSTQPEQRSFPSMAPYNPRRVCSGRDPRTLFFLDDNAHLLVRLNTATGVATPMSLADAASAICFDQQRNEVVVLSSAARRISRIDPATLATRSQRQLPVLMVIADDPRIAVCPVGGYIWLTSGAPTGYGLVDSGASNMAIAATISDSQPLRGVDTDDRGHVFTTAGGQTVEFMNHGTTVLAWTRVGGVSRFGSLANGPIFRIAKSRSNYERSIHDSPSETLAILPDTFAPGVADCPADFNNSGDITVQDIFDFLAAYFSGAASADVNVSGAVTVQDIFDYLAAYFSGCN